MDDDYFVRWKTEFDYIENSLRFESLTDAEKLYSFLMHQESAKISYIVLLWGNSIIRSFNFNEVIL